MTEVTAAAALSGARALARPYALAGDLAYVLDNMLEDDLIDGATYTALTLFVPQAAIDAEINGEPRALDPPPYALDSRRRLGVRLRRVFDAWAATAPPEVRGGLAYMGMRWLDHTLTRYSDCVAHWGFDDETVGGAMKAWLPRVRVSADGGPCPKSRRRLASPRFVKRYVREQLVEIPWYRLLADSILDEVARVEPQHFRNELDLEACYDDHRAAARRVAEEHWKETLATRTAPPRLTRPQRRRRDATRRATCRALRLAEEIVGEAPTRDFVRGGEVRLPGTAVDLVVSRLHSVMAQGHGALEIMVHEPAGGRLAHLCTYIPSTPALDQLVSLSLAMAAGDEELVLADGNLSRLTETALAHPLIKARLAARPEPTERRPEPIVVTGRARRFLRAHSEARKETREAYVAERMPLWRERIEVEVCGRRAKMLARFREYVALRQAMEGGHATTSS